MTDKDKNHDKDKHAPPPPPQPKEPLAGGIKGASTNESTALPPEAYMTEQEKEALKKSSTADKKETK